MTKSQIPMEEGRRPLVSLTYAGAASPRSGSVARLLGWVIATRGQFGGGYITTELMLNSATALSACVFPVAVVVALTRPPVRRMFE